jgi:hypothetical protein
MLDVCCHPLDVLAIIASITLIFIIIRGFFFEFPLVPLLCATQLELLLNDVFLLFLLLLLLLRV